MKKYAYLTESISYSFSKKNLVSKLDELIGKRAQEGWRLFKFDFSDWLGACVVVFEREAEE